MEVFEAITALVDYAEAEKLIFAEDRVFARNRLLEALGLEEYREVQPQREYSLQEILASLLDHACNEGLCEDTVSSRDLFDTGLMGLLTPRPSEVIRTFREKYAVSPKEATDYYYHLSRKSDYIREYRIKNDMKWIVSTDYGDMDITINLSKPEKDPKAIAAALRNKNSSYPACMLCKENEGYSGRVGYPARQNHRIIPLDLAGDRWFLQYSPYVYYNEHCIVFDEKHVPMKVSDATFAHLFAFIKQFPHYFIGSNADLPIAGGSILTHEHFQGGRYSFAMEKAPVETPVSFRDFPDVDAGIVKWPMSVIRLAGEDSDRICALASAILAVWRNYTDEDAFIFSETEGTVHNTITPIARFRNGRYELDLVLRNNITTPDYPDGYYHPHPEYHHIKKENIGLIEVMGLAVLPPRLKTEMALLKDALLSGADIAADSRIAKHASWANEICRKYSLNKDNCEKILKDEIGFVFAAILEQCGVFGRDEKGRRDFLKFLGAAGGRI